MRSFASQVAVRYIKGYYVGSSESLLFTIFFTCNSNTSLIEDQVFSSIDVTFVRDDVYRNWLTNCFVRVLLIALIYFVWDCTFFSSNQFDCLIQFSL